jgi:hypothetical protein
VASVGPRRQRERKSMLKVRSIYMASAAAWPTSKAALAVNRKLLSRQTVSVNGHEVKCGSFATAAR